MKESEVDLSGSSTTALRRVKARCHDLMVEQNDRSATAAQMLGMRPYNLWIDVLNELHKREQVMTRLYSKLEEDRNTQCVNLNLMIHTADQYSRIHDVSETYSIDLILQSVNNAMFANRWDDLDLMLTVNPEMLTTDTIITILTATLPGRGTKLKNRLEFYNKAEVIIGCRNEPETDLLLGLGY